MPQDFNDKVFDEIMPVPKGTAPKTEDYIAGPNPTLRDFMGTGSNVLNMGATGAQLGALLGPMGAAGGGVLGAGLGALLPPSDAPVTDAAATAADLAASRLLPGGLNTGRRLARIAGTALAPGLGGLLGSQGDKALGFQKETPWGRITLYSALATPGAILGSLASEASPTAQAVERLKKSTGVEFPLSTSEETGRFGGYEQMLTAGTAGAKALGAEQNAAARVAFEKIANSPLEKSLDVIMRGGEIQKDARKVMNDWRSAWQQANPQVTVQQVPSSVLGPNGQPLTQTVTTTSKPAAVNWKDFSAHFGLSDEERNAFFRAIRTDPESFVNAMIPGGENQARGLLKLRAVMTVLDKGGNSTEAGQLGQAVVMRYLGTPEGPFGGVAVNGKDLAARIETALGSSTEPGHLVEAIGPQRAEALRDLATVLKDTAPLEKLGDAASAQKRAGNYLFNKIAFASASAGAVGAFGHNALPVGQLVMGMGAGALVGIGIPTIIGAMMTKPVLGKVLIAASKGDSAAAGRLFRTLTSSKDSASDKGESFDISPSAASSRLQGLFTKK